MSNFRESRFEAGDLRKVADAPSADDPPLAVGDICELNSSSPAFLIVDVDGDNVTVAWRCPESKKVIERKIPRACVRRSQRSESP